MIIIIINNNYLYWSCMNNFSTYLYVAATFLICSSKAALDMLTKVMGLELGQYNVSTELPV